MCAHSRICDCDWPTFYVNGWDMPIQGPYALAEVLVAIPDFRRAHVNVAEDDGFARSNFIGCSGRARVRDGVRRLGQDPTDFRCLDECR